MARLKETTGTAGAITGTTGTGTGAGTSAGAGTTTQTTETHGTAALATAPDPRLWILGLSALTPAALRRARIRLAVRLEADPGLDLDDVVATLAGGRELFPVRCAILGVSRAALVEALRSESGGPAITARGTDPAEYASAPAERGTDPAGHGRGGVALPAAEFAGALRTARDWCSGLEADLTRGRAGRRVRLPGYSFDRLGLDAARNAQPAGDEERSEIRALTPHEQRWLFHDLARSGSSAAEHFPSATGALGAPADLPSLRTAFARLQRRHPLLRTVFERHGGGWRARTLPEAALAPIAVAAGAAAAPEAAVELVGTPLVRCVVTPADAADPAVTLTVYEPMTAGAGVESLLGELLTDYAHTAGELVSASAGGSTD